MNRYAWVIVRLLIWAKSTSVRGRLFVSFQNRAFGKGEGVVSLMVNESLLSLYLIFNYNIVIRCYITSFTLADQDLTNVIRKWRTLSAHFNAHKKFVFSMLYIQCVTYILLFTIHYIRDISESTKYICDYEVKRKKKWLAYREISWEYSDNSILREKNSFETRRIFQQMTHCEENCAL